MRLNRSFRLLLVALLAVVVGVVAACGGGGSDDQSDVEVVLQGQPTPQVPEIGSEKDREAWERVAEALRRLGREPGW